MTSEKLLKSVGSNIQEKAALIWNVANTLVGLYKPHEYGLVILPIISCQRVLMIPYRNHISKIWKPMNLGLKIKKNMSLCVR